MDFEDSAPPLQTAPPRQFEEPPPWDEPPLEAYDAPPAEWEAPTRRSGGAMRFRDVPVEQKKPVVGQRPPLQILSEVFGYDSFRPMQGDVIHSVLALRDTLAIMPTGGGKSLCYQLPALLFNGLTVVVSPLISLMQDQVRQLDALGIGAVVLNSSLDRQTYNQNRDRVRDGRARLLYLAPESLFLDKTLSLLRAVPVSCLTIDEAHCISEWGHDFRPEYRRLTEIRQMFPDAVCIGLTATATPRVREDIAKTLGFSDDARFVASFDRPNLTLRVQHKEGPLGQLLAFIDRMGKGPGIVYCATRKTVEKTASSLAARGHNARPYHAGLPENVRRENQSAFIRDDVDIICATVAFGMGINKPDVRFVAHHDMPGSIESYYQEIGRAGRDGLSAECLLLYGAGDLAKREFFISQKSAQEQRVARLQLSRMQAFSEANMCRRKPLLDYFGETYQGQGCGACDNCLEPAPDLRDVTTEAQKFLSCVYRTGQRYGATHIVDVLRGSKNKKILTMGHDRLSTYGIGQEHDAGQWKHLARQFIQLGLLLQDAEYGSLELTADAGEVLRSRQTVEGRIRAPSKIKKRSSSRSPVAMSDGDRPLFEALRIVRKELAVAGGLAPYMVFADRTLMDMAAELPRTRSQMAGLHGVGQVKLERYAEPFLGRIIQWCREAGMADSAPEAETFQIEEPRDTTQTDARRQRIVTGLNRGESIASLAEKEGVKADTIGIHLEKWIEQGGPLEATVVERGIGLPIDQVTAALDAFDRCGAERLKPAYDDLDGVMDYDALRLLRILWRMTRE
ncbi:MAG: ATP-dependent DNA helicase RecQ [Myxococcota bacterium]|jgi:ATP-dependent DNA helicase RecQ